MTVGKLQRIANLALSLLMIACGVVLLLDPEEGLFAVAFVLSLALVLYGARMLMYYVTMARHMVGGLSLLFISVITIDIGAFSLTVIDDPRLSIVLFLVSYNAFTGILDIARGLEAKSLESSWMPSVAHGLVNIVLAVLCLVFVSSDEIVVAIFCICLFYSAIIRLISVFRRTEIIYIQ